MSRLRFVPFVLLLAAVNAHAALIITPQPHRFADADGTVPLTLFIATNLGDAQDLQVSWFDSSQTITPSVDPTIWTCSTAFAQTTCKFRNVLSPEFNAQLDLHFRFDQPYARRELTFDASANVNGSTVGASVTTGAVLYKRFIVTQAGDAGDGSLRAAVEALDADPQCADVPCSIDFDLGPATIALQSPLPRIKARDVLVDDSIHPGQVTLDGAAAPGNALDFDVRERAEVANLRIIDFSDNAVLLRLHRRETATDPSARLTVGGCTIERNFRGINFAPGYLGPSRIANNTLRDNVRTAIFDGSEHDPAVPLQPPLRIEGNTIIGNGASGIYFGPGSDGALITGNDIESNHDFGIAVARGARNVRVLPNSIAHNGSAAIDVGLDGPTPVLNEGAIGDRNAAVIDSARFDEATQTTIITGRPGVNPIGTCDLCFTHTVSIYANDAPEHGQYAEAQRYLGEAKPNGSGFIFTMKGNLRGNYITALVTRWYNLVGSDFFDTAELSKAVPVQ